MEIYSESSRDGNGKWDKHWWGRRRRCRVKVHKNRVTKEITTIWSTFSEKYLHANKCYGAGTFAT